MGISFLGMLYSITNVWFPKHAKLNLYGSMALVGFSNYLIEMSSSPLNILVNHQLLTDWPDFISGVMGIATFYVSTMILEKNFKLKLKKLCDRSKLKLLKNEN
jgi:hypothetical protein